MSLHSFLKQISVTQVHIVQSVLCSDSRTVHVYLISPVIHEVFWQLGLCLF